MLYTMYLVCFRGREICRCACLTCVRVLVAVFNCTNSVSLSYPVSVLAPCHRLAIKLCNSDSILTMADMSSCAQIPVSALVSTNIKVN